MTENIRQPYTEVFDITTENGISYRKCPLCAHMEDGSFAKLCCNACGGEGRYRIIIQETKVAHPSNTGLPPGTIFSTEVGGLSDPFKPRHRTPPHVLSPAPDPWARNDYTGGDDGGKHSPQAEPGSLDLMSQGRQQAGMEIDNVDNDDDIETKPVAKMDPVQNALSFVLREVFGDAQGMWDDGLEKTAARVIRSWGEYAMQPASELDDGPQFDFPFTTFPAHGNQLVVCKDIEFSSLCAHHLLPFYGLAHIGYIPHKLQVGLSKLPRLVDFWARRPQVQERLTEQIADSLKQTVDAMGVAVVIEARHTCMACRGVRKHNGIMLTSNMKGVFLTASAARGEFMQMIERERL